MKRMLCPALICVVTCTQVAGLGAQTQTPGTITGAVLPSTGVISGTVASSSGRRLSGITMQLVNPSGVVVGKVVTTRNGEFSFPPTAYDIYTLQCVDDNRVIGTSSVTLAGATQSVSMVCTSDAAFWWRKWGLLAGLGAAATAIGAAAVVAAGDDASGSR